MSRFFRALRAGVKGMTEALGPGRYSAADRPILCQHCRAGMFVRREAQMNTAGMAFLDLEWMNRSGTALICVACGLIQWFAREPERLDG